MTLKEALRTYIAANGPYTGPFFMGAILDPKIKRGILLRDAGSHDSDPSGFKLYPVVEVILLGTDQAELDQLAFRLFGLFNLQRPLQLAPGYRVGRCAVPSPPDAGGIDEVGLWTRSLTLNLSVHKHAQL